MKELEDKIALVREAFVALTRDTTEAVILNQFVYWSQRISNFSCFMTEEKEQFENKSDSIKYGWIYKSSVEMKEEIMWTDSAKTISRKISSLVEKGFIYRRKNPKVSFDHKYQYRVNLKAILTALSKLGYMLNEYKVDLYSFFELSIPVKQKMAPESSHTKDISNDITDGSFLADLSDDVQDKREMAMQATTIEDSLQAKKADTQNKAEKTSRTESVVNYDHTPSKWEKQKDGSGGTHFRIRRDHQKKAETLNALFDSIDISNVTDNETIIKMKPIISDLWFNECIGKKHIPHDEVNAAVSYLSRDSIQTIFDKYAKQERKGLVGIPSEYIKTIILNNYKEDRLRSAAIKSSGEGIDCGSPSFDIDDFVRLSMDMLHNSPTLPI